MNTETTYNGYEPAVGSIRGQSVPTRVAAAVRRAARRLVKSMLQSYWERQTVRELGGLPSYVLRDIGMRPDDIREVAGDLARERADAWARRADASNGFGG